MVTHILKLKKETVAADGEARMTEAVEREVAMLVWGSKVSATFGGVQVRSGLSEVGWDQVWLRQNKRLSQEQSVWLL